MSKKFVGLTYFLIVSMCVILSFNFTLNDQNKSANGQKVTLSVSATQEKNFNLLISWLNNHKSLKLNSGLKNSYQLVHNALKNNNYSDYIVQVGNLSNEIKKLSVTESKSLKQFITTLTVPKAPNLPHSENNCSVTCQLGSCTINCPDGTKPKCFCQDGNPQCGCEPYGG